jgi:hypothetical protein
LPLLIAPDAMLSLVGVVVPSDLLFHRISGLLVVSFGVVYFLIAQDLTRYRQLVWLGVAGKAGVVVLFTQAFLAGLAPFPAFAISLGDLVFGVGFLAFLLTTRQAR